MRDLRNVFIDNLNISIDPGKHHKRIPPFVIITKKSNILTTNGTIRSKRWQRVAHLNKSLCRPKSFLTNKSVLFVLRAGLIRLRLLSFWTLSAHNQLQEMFFIQIRSAGNTISWRHPFKHVSYVTFRHSVALWQLISFEFLHSTYNPSVRSYPSYMDFDLIKN